ncbi:tannase/feruloyl esterase family alpha/beta hydrolase [Histidinibacterium lentulum]|nr:tannase/feruloyl esterase family alpha/beta hydrolase [Histidinibacterium lentulum]
MLLRCLIPGLVASAPALACQSVAEVDLPLLANVEGTDPVPHCRVQVLMASGQALDLHLPVDWSGRLFHLFDPSPLTRDDLLTGGAAVLEAPFEAETLPRADDLALAAYGRLPDHVYAAGTGAGALAALAAAVSVPGDYDGLYLVSPALGGARRFLQEAHGIQTLAPLRGPLHEAFSEADLTLVADAVLAACDALDGLADGIVFDIEGCRANFDPFRLACAETSLSCLFPERLEALVILQDGPRTDLYDPLYAPWPWPPSLGDGDWRTARLGTPESPPAGALTAAAELAAALGLGTDDPLAFLAALDIPDAAARLPDSAPDAEAVVAFGAEGGRILVLHPADDLEHSLFRSALWIDRLHEEDPATDEILRLYAVPEGPVPDLLPRLVDWVEQDAPPGAIPQDFAPGARPLCPWPLFAVHLGGDPAAAASFTCAGSG